MQWCEVERNIALQWAVAKAMPATADRESAGPAGPTGGGPPRGPGRSAGAAWSAHPAAGCSPWVTADTLAPLPPAAP
ncbi:hypothetical protein GCM10010363_67300 [Streptomyces omiyaensis]|nr:hypothetical protein GCM10010363_67300 [Streptomyces omiyaensis]